MVRNRLVWKTRVLEVELRVRCSGRDLPLQCPSFFVCIVLFTSILYGIKTTPAAKETGVDINMLYSWKCTVMEMLPRVFRVRSLLGEVQTSRYTISTPCPSSVALTIFYVKKRMQKTPHLPSFTPHPAPECLRLKLTAGMYPSIRRTRLGSPSLHHVSDFGAPPPCGGEPLQRSHGDHHKGEPFTRTLRARRSIPHNDNERPRSILGGVINLTTSRWWYSRG